MSYCPTNLPPIPNMTCGIRYGQVQKIAFTRIGNLFSNSSNPITDLASWTAFLSAEDSTKIVVTPYVEAPTMEGGDEKTFGGGNTTLDGIIMVLGSQPIRMSFALRNYPQTIISALKVLTKIKDLGVFLFNDNGGIICLQEGGTYLPIPIRALFVGDLILSGRIQPDRNTMKFSFKSNYSDKLVVVKPNFSPVNDLANIDVHIGDGSFSLAFNPSYDI
mgnify:FL=1